MAVPQETELEAIAGITSLLLGVAANPEAASGPSPAIWPCHAAFPAMPERRDALLHMPRRRFSAKVDGVITGASVRLSSGRGSSREAGLCPSTRVRSVLLRAQLE